MKFSRKLAIPGALIAVLGIATRGSGQATTSVNPVQLEMRLLRDAMRSAVDSIAAGEVRGLPEQLHAVHVAAGDTRSALEKREYVLPSGADQIDAFLALDEAFHRALIKMVKAAKKNDVAATAEQFGVLMNRCEGCHARYRGQREAAD
jgi:DNA-binding GntR family transcriptional regulator